MRVYNVNRVWQSFLTHLTVQRCKLYVVFIVPVYLTFQVAIRDVMPEATVTAFECKFVFHTISAEAGTPQPHILHAADQLESFQTDNKT